MGRLTSKIFGFLKSKWVFRLTTLLVLELLSQYSWAIIDFDSIESRPVISCPLFLSEIEAPHKKEAEAQFQGDLSAAQLNEAAAKMRMDGLALLHKVLDEPRDGVAFAYLARARSKFERAKEMQGHVSESFRLATTAGVRMDSLPSVTGSDVLTPQLTPPSDLNLTPLGAFSIRRVNSVLRFLKEYNLWSLNPEMASWHIEEFLQHLSRMRFLDTEVHYQDDVVVLLQSIEESVKTWIQLIPADSSNPSVKLLYLRALKLIHLVLDNIEKQVEPEMRERLRQAYYSAPNRFQ